MESRMKPIPNGKGGNQDNRHLFNSTFEGSLSTTQLGGSTYGDINGSIVQ